MKPVDYASSGVDLREGQKAVDLMKRSVRKTFTKEVLSDIGHFGGLFRAEFPGIEEPVLVASTDGVGTKLKVASMTGRYGTVGMDLVNHCVNDILVQGASPLFFMDYIACGSLDSAVVAEIVGGLAEACVNNGCALLGGETAEMPGFYGRGDYDVAGTIIGVVDRNRIIDGSSIEPGDAVIGIPSTGLHTNGYSLARKVLFENSGLGPGSSHPLISGRTVGEVLLDVHRSYLHCVRPLLEKRILKGIAHITGGGIPGNLCRILPDGCGAEIICQWDIPPVFRLLQELGGIDDEEMRRAFNMGAGLLLVAGPDDADTVIRILEGSGESPFPAGRVVEGEDVRFPDRKP